MTGPGAPGERAAGPVPAVRRLASWLRTRTGVRPSADAPETARPPAAPAPPPPPSRLRPQPEDDASVYPLF